MNQRTVRKIRRAARTVDAIKYLPPARIRGPHGASRGIPSQHWIEKWVKRAYKRGLITPEQLNRMAR